MSLDFGCHSNKVCSANEAVSTVGPGSHVFVGTGCATPQTLIRALESVVSTSDDITILSFVTDGAVRHENGRPVTNCRHKCFFVSMDHQETIKEGTAEYTPISLAQLPVLIRNGRFPIDVSFIQVSAPDRNGYVSLGVSVDIGLTAARFSKKVIAEVNPNMPFTFGDSVIHLDDIDHLVINDSPVHEYVYLPADDVAQQVAAYIAGIIDDGSTLQIGLGRVPNAALSYLRGCRDLGIHSDVITGGLLDLIERGVITGRKKTLHPDKIVTSYCLGTKRLYDYIHLNPMFEFRPIEYICDPFIIAGNNRMVSVTQAFAVDLTGQICTDQLEGNFYGGVSTQPDFLRGAARSPGGKPIVCLRSTSEDGKQSRIRPQLLLGEGVGISRADIHYVVTEYGMAYLFGKSIRERALSLIEIASPEFRPWLLEEAKRLRYLPPSQALKSQKGYAIEEERIACLKNGKSVRLRPARASDADSLLDLFHALSAEDIYTRFFQRLRTLNFNQIQQLCNVSFEHEAAFMAVEGDRENEKIIGTGFYALDPTTNVAEVGYMIAPEWQDCGLGNALQNRMKEHAVAKGIHGFMSVVLNSNKKMISLAHKAGSNIKTARNRDLLEITVYFD